MPPAKRRIALERPNGKKTVAVIEPAGEAAQAVLPVNTGRRGRTAAGGGSNVIPFDRVLEGIKGNRALHDIVREAMKEYGAMTVEGRAINDYRDGLKPVHRRILWAMYNMGLKASGGYSKCAKVIGDVIGNYHPHGDLATYEALVKMVAGTALPLIDGMGNFGTMTDNAAAYRYTECRLHTNAEQLLLEPESIKILDTVPNFDSTKVEPLIFVSNLPLLFLVGTAGIAVGTTTNVPSFTLESLSKLISGAMRRSLKAGKKVPITAADCAATLRFSHVYGGEVVSTPAEILQLFSGISGPIRWRATTVWDAKSATLNITGFPPEWGFDGKYEKLGNIPGVKQVVEGEAGLRVVFRPRLSHGEIKDTHAAIEKLLYSTMNYRINVTERYLADDQGMKVARARFASQSIPEVINRWIDWRVQQQVKIIQRRIADLREDLHRQNLLLHAINNLEGIFKILRTKGIDKQTALQTLLKVNAEDAKTIWLMAIGRFDRLTHAEQTAKIADLRARIAASQAELKQSYAVTLRTINERLGVLLAPAPVKAAARGKRSKAA